MQPEKGPPDKEEMPPPKQGEGAGRSGGVHSGGMLPSGSSTANRKRPAAAGDPRDESVSSLAEDSQGSTTGRKRKHDIPYKGVYQCRMTGGQFWQSQISIDGTTYHLGVFDNIADAARAYDAQARLLGRRLNFPEAAPAPAEAGIPGAPGVSCDAPADSRPLHITDSAVYNDLDDEKREAFWHGNLAPLTVGRFPGDAGGPMAAAAPEMPLFHPLPHMPQGGGLQALGGARGPWPGGPGPFFPSTCGHGGDAAAAADAPRASLALLTAQQLAGFMPATPRSDTQLNPQTAAPAFAAPAYAAAAHAAMAADPLAFFPHLLQQYPGEAAPAASTAQPSYGR